MLSESMELAVSGTGQPCSLLTLQPPLPAPRQLHPCTIIIPTSEINMLIILIKDRGMFPNLHTWSNNILVKKGRDSDIKEMKQRNVGFNIK